MISRNELALLEIVGRKWAAVAKKEMEYWVSGS
jgi:hypothetical protein